MPKLKKESFTMDEQMKFAEAVNLCTAALQRCGMHEAKALAGLMSFAAIGAIDCVGTRRVAESLRGLADQIEADGAAKH
ncbi:hypothetical protein GOC72_28440 [Sinorhizobium medicae]|nr:hypothetical protein [Sinorhizobium meliloti]MDW9896344.1 hypothetical protein [Sinorhizobium meliloti]MDX0022279.1 hypothetical protein [Sinorhizobium meliloti]MDX0457337.1 hypothetical protein [Sinorhizobium medicae]